MGEVAARSDAGGGESANDADGTDNAGATPARALRADPPHEGEGNATAAEVPAEAEEPKLILLWRQARFTFQSRAT